MCGFTYITFISEKDDHAFLTSNSFLDIMLLAIGISTLF